MLEPTYIVGVAQTTYSAARPADTFADLAFEVAKAAIEDAGGTIADIDNVITVSNDFFDGRTISSMAVQHAVGAWQKNTSCVEGDGLHGAFYGLARILSGTYATTLVVAHHKGSVSSPELTTNAYFDPIYERSLGMDLVTGAAMAAGAFLRTRGASEDDLAQVVYKSRINAARNPLAQLRTALSFDEIRNSQRLADPLREFDCAPVSDGAAAIVIANETGRARFRARPPVRIAGASFATEPYFLGDRDLTRAPALEKAAATAYAQAQIRDPASEVDVAEVADGFSYMEPMFAEALGLCDAECGFEMLAAGTSAFAGTLPINPSGGMLSARPATGVAGLAAIVEVASQLRGEAGDRQVASARTGVAHGAHGICAQGHAVMVLQTGEK